MAQTTRSFSIRQSANALVSSLNAFNPAVIATYPLAAAVLADEAEKGSLQVDLREVCTGGECLSAMVCERLKQVMGCTVLLTNLANTAQPFIRYDLADQVTLQTGRCVCGSPLR